MWLREINGPSCVVGDRERAFWRSLGNRLSDFIAVSAASDMMRNLPECVYTVYRNLL